MSIYEGISEVEPSRKTSSQKETVWITPGNYELEVTSVRDGKADQGEGRPYFVVEFDVLKSDNPEIEIGSGITWMTMRNKIKKYFLEDVQNFLAAATISKPHEITQDVVEHCTSIEQPLVGERVTAKAFAQIAKESGKEFTIVRYKSPREAQH